MQKFHGTRDFNIVHATMSAMFQRRIAKLKKQIQKEKLDAVFISSVSNIEYLTGYSNFSRDEREAYIFLGKNFGYIITDGRYSQAIIKGVPHLELFERRYKKRTEHLFRKHKKQIKRLGIEEDNLTVSEHKILKKHFKNTKHFDARSLRSIKLKEEISRIEKACKIGDLAFEFILKKIKTEVTEKEIADELEAFVRGKGATFSFPVIIAFGKNSAIPHHQTGDAKLIKGDFVLLDFGVKLDGYCSDMTRTIFFGKPSAKQRKIYETVLEAQQKAIDFINKQIRAGKKIQTKDVDKIARDHIKSVGFPDIPHSLGHGIGLEVHEHPHLSPKSREELALGMVFSIEPGIYIPNFGGVRVEDLFVLGKDGLRQLTASPKEIIGL